MSPRARRWLKRGAVLAAAAVALNVLVAVLGSFTSRPTGPPSSSYATTPRGFAAWAELLARDGRAIERVRERPSEARLDPSVTAVVLDPDSLSVPEARALRRFVEAGGRLLAGGARPAKWLGELMPGGPRWAPRGDRRLGVLAPAPEAGGVREVVAAGRGAWSAAGGALPVLGAGAGSAVAVASVGRGRLVLVADGSPLENAHLGRADNAALALALVGEPGRRVAFVESVHGFGAATGVEAIPLGWRVAIVGLGLAGLVFVLARGRRLGPPERTRRALAPPRSEFVRALAQSAQRAKAPAEGLAPLQASLRERLARRTGLRPSADERALRAAGERVGLSRAELDALSGELRTDDQVMAAGGALARLEQAPR